MYVCLSVWGLAGNHPDSLHPLTHFLRQGVEFFDEKLNSLCMAWLVDHGECLRWAGGGDGAPGIWVAGWLGPVQGVSRLESLSCASDAHQIWANSLAF